MAKFNVGTKVIKVNNHSKGSIIRVYPLHKGKQIYRVLFNQNEENVLEKDLREDINLEDPFEKIEKGIYGSYRDFLQINTAFKIHNTNNSNIATLKASKTIFKPYQYKPLLKILNSSNHRLLVADEVGLGKTIEAGHIMLELRARRNMQTALIVCPKSLQSKWQNELQEKFGLSFKIYDSITVVSEDLKAGRIFGIVNYEKIRKSDEKENEFHKLIGKTNQKIDLLVCDEAHRVRNSSTDIHKGIKHIMSITNAALFLTATPIMISRENLFNLLKLLDESEYGDYQIFENTMRVNEPFVKALNRLNKGGKFVDIAKELRNTEVRTERIIGEGDGYHWCEIKTIEERFKEVPLYIEIINSLTNKPDTNETRVQLQFDISSLSKLNNIFSRTRKREVTQDWSQATRNPKTMIVKLNPKERMRFEEVIDTYINDNSYVDEWGCDVMPQGKALGLVQKKRQVASSVYAYLNDLEDLQKGIDKYCNYPDAKLEKLLEIIEEVVNRHNKKLIVFSLFKKTLMYLEIRLRKAGIESIMIHGGINNRSEVLQEFRDNSKKKILLSSEVGSEGLDMQFCDALVNYDLPWNPMVVEQRIGRIDRFGQQSEVVNIYNLIVKDSIQEEIYARLLDRIGIFKSSIGDLEAILDSSLENSDIGESKSLRQNFSDLEKELYTTKLDKEEREQKIENIAQAILWEKKNAEELNDKLTNTLTNDIRFRTEIENILNRKQYITEKELISFVHKLIESALPTCQLIEVDRELCIHKFRIPKGNPNLLTNFLCQHELPNDDYRIENALFRNRIRGKIELSFTFRQETAYMDNSLIYVNAYHPIILSALHFFEEKKSATKENTFKYSLKSKLLPAGNYCLALYEIRQEFIKYGTIQIIKILTPVLYDYSKGKVIGDKEKVKKIFGEAQDNVLISETNYSPTKDELLDMRIGFTEAIGKTIDEIIEDQRIRIESLKILDIQRIEESYNAKIENKKDVISNIEWNIKYSSDEKKRKDNEKILPAQRAQLSQLEEEKEHDISRIKSTGIKSIDSTLLSLSQISII